MRRLIFFLLLLLVALGCSLTSCDTARNMESPFNRYFFKYIGRGGDQSGVDMAQSTIDRSIFLFGNSKVLGSDQQLYVAHVTAEGNVLWDKLLGGDREDEACDIELLSDSTTIAILSTATDESGSYRNFSIRFMDLDGNMIDSVSYGRSRYHYDAISLSETTNSYIVSGSMDSTKDVADPQDAFALRFLKPNLGVDPEWLEPIGSITDLDLAIKTLEAAPFFYTFGYAHRLGPSADAIPDYEVVVWQLAPNGDLISAKVFFNSSIPGSGLNDDERLGSVSEISNGGGFVLSGYSSAPAGDNKQRLFAMKIRPDLNGVDPDVDSENHEIYLNAAPRLDDESRSDISILRTSTSTLQGEGYFLLGGTGQNIYLKKLTRTLRDAWTSPPSLTFGGAGNDLPATVLESAADGRILVLGTMVLGGTIDGQTKIVLMKLSPTGKLGE